MIRVVGVRFKKAGKVYYFDPADFTATPGAKVVVETARGVEYGEVAVGPKEVPEDQVVQPLKKVLRLGNEKDAVVAAENKRKENDAFGIAQKKIEGHNLEMNLVDVEYTFDGSKIIFYFTAEGRIDFRELVRDLASVFRTRIEMRQIGVRDEAKLLGGIGPCGRILCCTSFLGDFAPVSIRMAKDQNLSLNPSKISGLCGRLMCCLRYEQETYEAAKKDPTLAPGYVPPVLLEDAVPNLDELEDKPAPAIGVRQHKGESGMSARIAQAAGIAERPQRREERSGERRSPGQADRPTGGSERPQGQPRPQPQGQGAAKGHGQPRPQGQGPGGRPQGERSQPAQPKQQGQPRQQGKPRPQGGERQHPGEKSQGRPQQQQQAQPQQRGQRGQQSQQDGGQQAQAQAPQKEGQNGQTGGRPHHRRRRGGGGKGGGNQQGGPNPQGGGNPQA